MSITRDEHAALVSAFSDRRIIVLGDLMMDEYLWGRTSRISPEAPVMVVDVERESSVPGGAANVVNNLLALGAKVSVIGVVGDDAGGDALSRALQQEGADVSGLVVDASRPTTRKTRIVAHNQQVLRVDREQTHAVGKEVAKSLLERLETLACHSDALLISDYNKGVVTPDVAREAVASARRAGIHVTANPKPASAGWLGGAKVLQLNQSEAISTATRMGMDVGLFSAKDEFAEALGEELREKLGVDTLLVTRGARGITFWSENERRHIPPHVVEVYDSAGAGDTVISALTLSLAAEADVYTAAVVANHAAACVVRKLGVATVTPKELLAEWT
jgi:D-glycero-beta-D-manno-heptose-7-phosphate kinase